MLVTHILNTVRLRARRVFGWWPKRNSDIAHDEDQTAPSQPSKNFQYVGLAADANQVAEDVKTLGAIVPPRIWTTSASCKSTSASACALVKTQEDTECEFVDLQSIAQPTKPLFPRLAHPLRTEWVPPSSEYHGSVSSTSPSSNAPRSHLRTRSYGCVTDVAPTFSQQLFLAAHHRGGHNRSRSLTSHATNTRQSRKTPADLIRSVKTSKAYSIYRTYFPPGHPQEIQTPRGLDTDLLDPALNMRIVLSWKETIESKSRGLEILQLINKPPRPANLIF